MVQIGLPNFIQSTAFRNGIIALLISIAITFSVVTQFNIVTVFVIGILMILVLTIMSSSRSTNYEGSLPSTTYPIPPHLGLDGVSLVNQRG